MLISTQILIFILLDGVVSYSMKQGEKRGAEVDFYDFTYDGIISPHHLSDGLGQLTDGEMGDTNFRLDPQDLGMKGYEWVGWKNDTLEDPGPVTITFKFDTVRNFTSMKLFCNNYFTKDVRVFRVAVVYYSIGGQYFKKKKDKFNFIRDTVVEYARYVQIKLDHIIARFIKIELYFDAKWILISEVQFDSGRFTDVYINSAPDKTGFEDSSKGIRHHVKTVLMSRAT